MSKYQNPESAPYKRPTTDDTETLAATFAGVLRGWASQEEWHEMRATNRRYQQEGGMSAKCCASHEFCDANMAMHEAWLLLFQRGHDGESESDMDLTNSAWSLAKRLYLTADRDEDSEPCGWCGSVHPHLCVLGGESREQSVTDATPKPRERVTECRVCLREYGNCECPN